MWKWQVGFEQERQPTFRNNTDEVSNTTAGIYKIGPQKE
jgi:hypothetical protein